MIGSKSYTNQIIITVIYSDCWTRGHFLKMNFEENNQNQMSLEELKIYVKKCEEDTENSLNEMKKLNDIFIKKLDVGPSFPQVHEKTAKLKERFIKLSELIKEKNELSKSIESGHESLKSLYLEQKRHLLNKDPGNSANTEEILEIRAERDKALGLAKVLLATLKSSRMQSEDNFHKLKHSSDLMFHILYKAEDAFLNK